MNKVFTRRLFLKRAPTAVAAVALPTASAVAFHADPVTDLVDRYIDLWPRCPTSDFDEAANARWSDEVSALEAEIAATMPTTRAGALSVLRFLAFKMRDNAVDGEMSDALAASIAILAREG